jgi:hypothetical protein
MLPFLSFFRVINNAIIDSNNSVRRSVCFEDHLDLLSLLDVLLGLSPSLAGQSVDAYLRDAGVRAEAASAGDSGDNAEEAGAMVAAATGGRSERLFVLGATGLRVALVGATVVAAVGAFSGSPFGGGVHKLFDLLPPQARQEWAAQVAAAAAASGAWLSAAQGSVAALLQDAGANLRPSVVRLAGTVSAAEKSK